MIAPRATTTVALLGAILCAVLAAAPPARAAVTLRFTPADTTVALGATSHLSIWLDEPLEVRTVEVWVRFDPAILTSLSGGKGSLCENHPFPVSADDVVAAMIAADALGHERKRVAGI